MDCPACGAANEAEAIYCYRCGSALRPGVTRQQPSTEQTIDLSRDYRAAAATAPVDSAQAPPASGGGAAGGARVYQIPARRPPAPYVVGPVGGTAQTSNLAVFALILGILSWIFLPFLGAIGAVVTGHMGRREIRESNGRLSGEGLATAGLVLGYINIALTLIVFVAFCVLPLLFVAGASRH